ncbi:hypothetical protein KW799_02840 [Candidatus Parcubacteria bacterium]|nr:hypothetical protein [Candidatus Parcubacteria bacterium]
MTLSFFSTKIGISLLLAIVIIGSAVGIRYKEQHAAKTKGAATLVVEKIIRDSIANVNEIEKNNNLIASTTADSLPAESATIIPYTATDRLSQEIFREYIAAKKSGQEVTSDISSRIAESVLAQDYSEKKPLYSAINMKISGDSSVIALKSYGNALGSILSAPPAATNNELVIFQRLSSEPVDGFKADLLAIKKRYAAMEAKLLALPVPAELATAQADMANAIGIFIESVDGALSIDADPIGALGKIARYDDGIAYFERSIQAIRADLKKRNVSFAAQESGHVIME